MTVMLKFMRRFTVGAAALGASFPATALSSAPVRRHYLQQDRWSQGQCLRRSLRPVSSSDDIKLFDVRIRPLMLQTGGRYQGLADGEHSTSCCSDPVPSTCLRSSVPLVRADGRILPSVSNEILKAVVAEYKAEELIQRGLGSHLSVNARQGRVWIGAGGP